MLHLGALYVILLSHIMKLDLEHVWRGLSSPVRRQVLDLLRAGPLTTGELAERFPDLTRYAVMQHLGVLE
jgi:DNA-binding transcriptional ArsR family regulator